MFNFSSANCQVRSNSRDQSRPINSSRLLLQKRSGKKGTSTRRNAFSRRGSSDGRTPPCRMSSRFCADGNKTRQQQRDKSLRERERDRKQATAWCEGWLVANNAKVVKSDADASILINIIIAPLNQGHRVSPSLQFLPSGETDQFFLRRAPLAATLVFSFLAAYRTTCQSVSANYWRSGGGGPWGGMRAKSRSSQQLGKDVRFFLPFHSARKRRTYKKKKEKEERLLALQLLPCRYYYYYYILRSEIFFFFWNTAFPFASVPVGVVSLVEFTRPIILIENSSQQPVPPSSKAILATGNSRRSSAAGDSSAT